MTFREQATCLNKLKNLIDLFETNLHTKVGQFAIALDANNKKVWLCRQHTACAVTNLLHTIVVAGRI